MVWTREWTLVLSSVSLAVALAAPLSFPLYKQCDPAWGDDEMGVPGPGERDTICHQGCAMTCVAMALAGYGYTLPGQTSALPTPGTLNEWLVTHSGYRCAAGDCNNLVLDSPDVISKGMFQLVGEWGGKCCGGKESQPPLVALQQQLNASTSDQNMVFIAHVRNNTHFVLLTSWDSDVDAFRVNDPGFNVTHYSFDDMSDILMYSVFPRFYADVPLPYRLFKQFDYRWAKDKMTSRTIGAVGCLMSSTSMALNGHGINVTMVNSYWKAVKHVADLENNVSKPTNPGTFNAWLRTHQGYVGDNDMAESAVPGIDPEHVFWNTTTGMHRTNDISYEAVEVSLRRGQPVIANVMHGEHFVLVVGTDRRAGGTTLYVNDPGFYRNQYDFATDVVGWRLFNMSVAHGAMNTDIIKIDDRVSAQLQSSSEILLTRHIW